MWGQDKERGSGEGQSDTSLYHLAMQQLPFDPDDEVSSMYVFTGDNRYLHIYNDNIYKYLAF